MIRDAPAEAIILAGGLGTRLRSAVVDRPKPMANVSGRPFLAWILDQVSGWGVRSATLAIGHMADSISGFFGDRYGTLRLRYAREKSPLGTGGALRNALELSNEGQLIVMNGDSYCDIEIAPFWADHLRSGAPATIVLVHSSDNSRFGTVALSDDGSVEHFAARPDRGQPGLINAGIYAMRRQTIAALHAGRPVSLEEEVFPSLVGAGLRGWRAPSARFIDIGTPDSLKAAATFFETHPGKTNTAGG